MRSEHSKHSDDGDGQRTEERHQEGGISFLALPFKAAAVRLTCTVLAEDRTRMVFVRVFGKVVYRA